ncbi:MAG: ammonium transporter, partial [Alphaproteobacteria bacterium]|nr:ammonium transporter [Alphaproteobacteria bacterium]
TIGAIGGILIVVIVPLLDKLKIDDVVGAIPVYLIRGIWGTVAEVFSNTDAKTGIQLLGIIAIGGLVFVACSIVWMAIKMIMGVRPSDDDEALGLDRAECGMEVYPEFGRGP